MLHINKKKAFNNQDNPKIISLFYKIKINLNKAIMTILVNKILLFSNIKYRYNSHNPVK